MYARREEKKTHRKERKNQRNQQTHKKEIGDIMTLISSLSYLCSSLVSFIFLCLCVINSTDNEQKERDRETFNGIREIMSYVYDANVRAKKVSSLFSDCDCSRIAWAFPSLS